jgi:hypothetical protein
VAGVASQRLERGGDVDVMAAGQHRVDIERAIAVPSTALGIPSTPCMPRSAARASLGQRSPHKVRSATFVGVVLAAASMHGPSTSRTQRRRVWTSIRAHAL